MWVGVWVGVAVGVGVLVGVAVLGGIGVNVLVTVKVGVRVKVGGRSVTISAFSFTAFAATLVGASVGSTFSTATSGSSVQATIAANAPLTITAIAKSATRRTKTRLVSCANILKG